MSSYQMRKHIKDMIHCSGGNWTWLRSSGRGKKRDSAHYAVADHF